MIESSFNSVQVDVLHKINQHRIILGSRSPRRKNLLDGLGIRFEVITHDEQDEYYPPNLAMQEIPVFLARQKSKQYLKYMDSNTILITADTIVYIDNKVLGKPADYADATKILSRLSGRTHQVLTGVCIKSTDKESAFCSCSDVSFRNLSPYEISYYVSNYKPYDKAGAYGIQEWIGYVGIEKIEGSYYNVMGLPTERLFIELIRFTED
ncbi:MAG: septum formation protein Maf [Bacteroidales bacterium]|nr:septum formation protein Maf [Bacteroidales bacterium]